MAERPNAPDGSRRSRYDTDPDADMPGSDDPILKAFAHAPHVPPPNWRPGPPAGNIVLGNRYVVLERIGFGGMSEVYVAEDQNFKRKVAIKRIVASRLSDMDNKRRYSVFQKEVTALCRISHPNVIKVFDQVTWGDNPCLVLELLSNGSPLTERIGRGPASTLEAVRIVRRVARGLEAAHANGVIHRDLKPSNLWLHANGEVTVLDFGLASVDPGRASAERHDPQQVAQGLNHGSVVGTPGYMAPEQLEGLAQTPQTDIWAAGVILFQLVTQHLPFKTGSDVVNTSVAPELNAYLPDVDPDLDRIVRRCLEKRPEARFGTATELVEELEELETHLKNMEARRHESTASKRHEPTTLSARAAARRPEPLKLAIMGTQGGVGKSTTIAAMAELFASAGVGVLIIDMDLETAGLTKYVGARARTRSPVWSSLDVAYAKSGAPGAQRAGRAAAWDVTPAYLRKSRFGKVYLLPARHPSDTRAGYDAIAKIDFRVRNRAALEIIDELMTRASILDSPVDVILIDCGAENNPAVSAAFVRADCGFIISRPNPEMRLDIPKRVSYR